jgi:diguanylate cyclase
MAGPEGTCLGACLAVSKAAFDLSKSQGAAVLGLLERAQVPPIPAFYELFFDYVAGVKGFKAGRIGDILSDGKGQVQERLYSEFIEPYQEKQPLNVALDQMVGRLETIDRLVVKSAAATARHSLSLAEAGGQLESGDLDLDLVRDLVRRLEINNRAMRHANLALVTELDDAHHELVATRGEIDRSRESALRDPLTGIANRGGLDVALTRLLKAAPDHPLSVAVLDIDHFKALNDGYGHPVGDEVLRIVTRALMAAARATDIVGRPGGDEFMIILADADLSMAHNVADGIRAAIASSDLSAALGPDSLGGITASIGVAQLKPGEPVLRMLDRADRCLYRAKQAGRNRVDSFAESSAG